MLKFIKNFTSNIKYLDSIKKNSLMEKNQNKYRFYDIAANLTDDSFFGIHYQKKVHQPDVDQVIKRANDIGCHDLLIASGYVQDAKKAFQLCQRSQKFYTTIGIHPCRANYAFNKQKYKNIQQCFQELQQTLIKIQSKLVAIGQCGLDYDRFTYSSKQQQLAVFPYHFKLAQKYKLPMYLHNRNTDDDFFNIVKQNRSKFSTGVVHSFTGTLKELKQIIQLDLYVGINGCSLKTKENLQVLKQVPLDRIMLQTDAPYCEIRNSHASSGFVKTKFNFKAKQKHSFNNLVKGRNQPCTIIQVLQAASAVLKIDPFELSQIAYKNSIKLLKK